MRYWISLLLVSLGTVDWISGAENDLVTHRDEYYSLQLPPSFRQVWVQGIDTIVQQYYDPTTGRMLSVGGSPVGWMFDPSRPIKPSPDRVEFEIVTSGLKGWISPAHIVPASREFAEGSTTRSFVTGGPDSGRFYMGVASFDKDPLEWARPLFAGFVPLPRSEEKEPSFVPLIRREARRALMWIDTGHDSFSGEIRPPDGDAVLVALRLLHLIRDNSCGFLVQGLATHERTAVRLEVLKYLVWADQPLPRDTASLRGLIESVSYGHSEVIGALNGALIQSSDPTLEPTIIGAVQRIVYDLAPALGSVGTSDSIPWLIWLMGQTESAHAALIECVARNGYPLEPWMQLEPERFSREWNNHKEDWDRWWERTGTGAKIWFPQMSGN